MEQLTQELQRLNEGIGKLASATEYLTIEIRKQNAEQAARRKGSVNKRRSYPKIKSLGLEDDVIKLFNEGLTYAQISSRIDHRVSRSAIGRFIKRNILNS